MTTIRLEGVVIAKMAANKYLQDAIEYASKFKHFDSACIRGDGEKLYRPNRRLGKIKVLDIYYLRRLKRDQLLTIADTVYGLLICYRESVINMATKKKVKVVKRGGSSTTEQRQVTVMVNGQVTGTIPDTHSIGSASEVIATKAGLRSFSIKVDGKKVEQPDANKTLKGVKTFEIFAKDARG